MSQNQGNFEAIAKGLSQLLADSYNLYLKTQNYHWNVTGPQFHSLHLLFEGQYQDLATAVDEIAERIRTLGFRAPGSFAEFSKLSSVKEATGTPSAEDMVIELAKDQGTIISTIREVWEKAEEAGDEGTIDLLSGRLSAHEKAGWMLRSSV